MVEIKETSYKDERLGFFADQRKLVQKRYDRLEKQIKHDEPYLFERIEFLSDLGRELSFYNDIIEMLENDTVLNSKVDWHREAELNAQRIIELEAELAKVESEVTSGIFEEIEKLKHTKWDWNDYVDWDAIAELKKKYTDGIIDEEEKGECACNGCFHNCTTFCDFKNHCKKEFMELDEETDKRLGLISE